MIFTAKWENEHVEPDCNVNVVVLFGWVSDISITFSQSNPQLTSS